MTNSPDNLDNVLRSFFQRELPSRFAPAPGGEETTIARQTSSRTITSGRVLAGITLASIVAIYMSLAAFFPRTSPSGLNGPQIGERPAIQKQMPKK